MEEASLRKAAITQYLEGNPPKSIYYGMSRSKQWFYKWFHRYLSGSDEWHKDRPKTPHTNPYETSIEMRKMISNIRIHLERNPFLKRGVGAIKWELNRLGVIPPSNSTISRILKREELVNKTLIYPLDYTIKSYRPHGSLSQTVFERKRLTKKSFPTKHRDEFLTEKALTVRRDPHTHGEYLPKVRKTITLKITDNDRNLLTSMLRSEMTPAGLAKRSHIILTLAEGRTVSETAGLTNVSRQNVYKWAYRFNKYGIDGLNRSNQKIIKKADNSDIKSTIFSILHSPPSEYGINRTSWKIDDLKKCILGKGILVSKAVIRKIIRSAGFKWRRARVVLTSPDPEYRRKLTEIQSILAKLTQEERFFSIDEFGPFAIKKRGGRKLVPPGESPHVKQYQIPKASLIITAALELSHNKITHFYSPKKNTKEMIKLLEILLVEYKNCKKIFLSWDAATWHISKALYRRVDEINSNEYQQKNELPQVILAPLPKSAQFLNVIESVFSGMARAIIHNSDYESKESAIKAIDRYFEERNAFFKTNPCRAGKKIWGREIAAAEFSEGQNCKDPKWCRK